jgi:hypothetical protein
MGNGELMSPLQFDVGAVVGRIRELCQQLTRCEDDAQALKIVEELQTALHDTMEQLRAGARAISSPPRQPRKQIRTGNVNQTAGIYKSTCHPKERTILDGQQFPRCGSCNRDTNWILVRPRDKDALKTSSR